MYKSHLRFFILSLTDLLLLSASSFAAFFLLGTLSIKDWADGGAYSTIFFVVLGYLCLAGFKSYKTLWRFSGMMELANVAKALTLASLLTLAASLFFPASPLPVSFHILSWMSSILFVGGFRISRIMRTKTTASSRDKKKTALIIGAGEAGTLVARQLLQSRKAEYLPLGYIDDDPRKQGMEILGIPVLGDRSEIPGIVHAYGIREIIVAMPSAPKAEISRVVRICRQTPAGVKILPHVQDLIHGRVTVNAIREVDVKDLLGRDRMLMPSPKVNETLRNKVVLVTGAGGSIGSELSVQIARHAPQSLLLLGHGENSIHSTLIRLKERCPGLAATSIIADVQDHRLMEAVFRQYRPDVVFHAAAHKHVPLMEHNVAAAVKNNVLGTRTVAELSHQYGTERFVFISTDKAVNPVNIMGITKRIGELLIRQYANRSVTKFAAVRFGNVLESRGSVIPIFKKQIAMGGPVTVTHPDMVRYFMTIPEAVHLVLEAGALAQGGEIFVLDMGEPIRIADLAKTLIRLSGYEPEREIEIVYTGIRPGEKLSESLFYDEEQVLKSGHPDILISLSTHGCCPDLTADLERLEAALCQDDDQIRAVLQQIIRTHHP